MAIPLRRRNLEHLRALAEPLSEASTSDPLNDDEVAEFYQHVKTVKPMLGATRKPKTLGKTSSTLSTSKGKRATSHSVAEPAKGSGHATAAAIYAKYAVDVTELEPLIGCDSLTASDFITACKEMLKDKKHGYLYRSRKLALRFTMRGSSVITKDDWATAIGQMSQTDIIRSFSKQVMKIGPESVDTQVLVDVYEELSQLEHIREEHNRMLTDILEKATILIWLSKWDNRKKNQGNPDEGSEGIKEFLGKHQTRLTGERKLLIAAQQYGPIVVLLPHWRLDGFRNKEHCAPAAKANDEFYELLKGIVSTDRPAEERLEKLFRPAYESLWSLFDYFLGKVGPMIAESLMATVYEWEFEEE